MLTELLLEVTNEEIELVAEDVYKRARAKAAKGTSPCCKTKYTGFLHLRANL